MLNISAGSRSYLTRFSSHIDGSRVYGHVLQCLPVHPPHSTSNPYVHQCRSWPRSQIHMDHDIMEPRWRYVCYRWWTTFRYIWQAMVLHCRSYHSHHRQHRFSNRTKHQPDDSRWCLVWLRLRVPGNGIWCGSRNRAEQISPCYYWVIRRCFDHSTDHAVGQLGHHQADGQLAHLLLCHDRLPGYQPCPSVLLLPPTILERQEGRTWKDCRPASARIRLVGTIPIPGRVYTFHRWCQLGWISGSLGFCDSPRTYYHRTGDLDRSGILRGLL